MQSTALALNALTVAGVGSSDPVHAKARTYLQTVQNQDGGFGFAARQQNAALPTAAAIAVIIALGEDPSEAPWQKAVGANPVTALVALQDVSGGLRADASQPAAEELTTARALPGLAGRSLPVRPEPPAPPTEPTTPPQGGAPTSTVSTRPPSPPTSRAGGRTEPAVSTTAPSPTAPSGSPIELAAPGRGDDDGGGRSLVGLLPFVATLFGAGSVGLVLRRRARI